MQATCQTDISNHAFVAEVMSWIGTPYQHQASCKGAGCDCLGLVRGVYRHFWDEPEQPTPYSPHWAEAGGQETLALAANRYLQEVAPREVQPGHLLLFRYQSQYPAKHAGILVQQDRFVHAQHGSGVVLVSYTNWWRRHLAYAFAFPHVKY